MADSASTSAVHPTPYRHRSSLAELIFITFAPPLAWSAHLILNYAVASHTCFPDGTPQATPSFDGLRALLIGIDVASLAISVVVLLMAHRLWRASTAELRQAEAATVRTGEERTRFLALWGILIGLLFFVAVFFDFVGLWILPICG
jgi:hypothetical protein